MNSCVPHLVTRGAIIYFTSTSTKNIDVINIITPTITVLVAPAPTKAKTTSRVDIGAASIS